MTGGMSATVVLGISNSREHFLKSAFNRSRVVLKAFGVAAVASLCMMLVASSASAAWPKAITGPSQLATDADGKVFVAATGQDKIFELSPAGTQLLGVGSNGTSGGQFKVPKGVSVETGGAIFVADTGNSRIQRLFPNGSFQTEWGSNGSALGNFKNPAALAIDDGGNLFVADTGNDRVVRCNAWGWCGSQFTYAGAGGIESPQGIAVDNDGNIYVSDTGNSRVIKSSPTGSVLAIWSGPGAADGLLNGPSGLDVDAAGATYVADTGNNRIQKLNTTGNFVQKWTGPGIGTFAGPTGVAVDTSGSLFISDTGHNKVERIGGAVIPYGPTGGGGTVGPTGPTGPPGPTGPTGPSGGGSNNNGGNNTNGGCTKKCPVPDKKPRISKVKIIGANWIYADGYLNMQVAVTNSGKAPARVVEVSLASSRKKRIKPKPYKFFIKRIKPGWTVTKSFKVTARRGSRGKAVITAYAGGKKDKARLKIFKPYW